MEKKIIEHFCHKHHLILIENVSENESRDCYGCGSHITNLESAYVCIEEDCLDGPIFHKKCGELPYEIFHHKHPEHPLYLTDSHAMRKGSNWCNLCGGDLGNVLDYACNSCDFVLDIACEKISIDALLEKERKQLQHPSHPDHPLTLMRKSAFAFYCDGCGTQDVEDMAYICSICEFWIHKGCASLPLILPTDRHRHHHQLSLAFSIPKEHRSYIFFCDICRKKLDTTCWVYLCGDCRFFVHLRCASTETKDSNLEEEYDDDDDDDRHNVIQFPLDGRDIAKKLITPFVMREEGLNKIPDVKDMLTTVNMPEATASYSPLSNYHNHPLSLVIESLEEHNKISNDEDKDEDEDEDDEDEDEDEVEKDEMKICDMCVTPISSPPYYECASCKYSIHSICYLLPKKLSLPSPSSSSPPSTHHLVGVCPVTHNTIHKFRLYSTSPKWRRVGYNFEDCELCDINTNGTVYECEDCKKKMDVKCASLPTTIRHSSHPHLEPLIMTLVMKQDRWTRCHGCEYTLPDCGAAYCCSSEDCEFALSLTCAQLPASVVRHEWDKHPLLLTYDASLDHPDGFICAFCEVEMNPKKWMYHCRLCDNSFHVMCLRDASGYFRNVELGRKFVLDDIHPHPLTFNYVTLVKRCSICRGVVYDLLGLECAPCNFAICFRCSPLN